MVKYSTISLLVFFGLSCGGSGYDGAGSHLGVIGSQPVSQASPAVSVGLESSSEESVQLDLPSIYPVDNEWQTIFYSSIGDLDDVFEREVDEHARRIEACMRAKGFEFSMGEQEGPDIDEWAAMNPLNEATIKMGYHLPPMPDVVGDTETTEEMELALDGGDIDPEASSPTYPDEASRPCNMSPVLDKLVELRGPIDELTLSSGNDLAERTYRYYGSPEATAVGAEWSSCMKLKGFDYGDPDEPRLEFSEATTIEPLEVEVRTADYECDLEVGLTQTKSDWQRKQYEEWLDENAMAIKEFEDAVTTFSEELLVLESESLD